MFSISLLAATVIVAVILLISGVAKARDPHPLRAWADMGIPKAARKMWLARTHAYGEIALAVFLLALPGALGIAVAVVVLLLFVGYFVLIAKLVADEGDTNCNCFGSLGSGVVDRWTLLRNGVLVALAGLSITDLALNGVAAPRILDQFGWILALAVTALVTALVLGALSAAPQADPEDLEDYMRSPIPYVDLIGPSLDSKTTLRGLAQQQAVLLLMLSPSCSPCVRVTDAIPDIAKDLPMVAVRIVTAADLTSAFDRQPTWEGIAYTEVGHSLSEHFTSARPAAILLGADGLMAGGPVTGPTAILELVDEIKEQLLEAQG